LFIKVHIIWLDYIVKRMYDNQEENTPSLTVNEESGLGKEAE
jgi:hypothetical protein